MRNLLAILTLCLAPMAFADGPAFTNITDAQIEDVLSDFAANLIHTTVSPASSIGDVFGFEVGVVAGATTVPGVEKVSKISDPTSDITTIPHVALIGIASFPLGITGEIGILPSQEGGGVEVGSRSFAVKWTYSKLLPVPLDLSVKLHATSSETSFTQDQPVANTKIEYESTSSGLLFQASKSFAIIEPYVGLGFLKSTGKISAPVDIFADTNGTSVEKEVTGTQVLVGANLNLMLVKLGLEAGKVFDSTKATAKVSFYF